MSREIIEKLKTNTVAWVFLTDDEKQCIRQANEKGAVLTLTYNGVWESCKRWSCIGEGAHEIWRIRTDYEPEPEPEPEYEDIPIEISSGRVRLKTVCPNGCVCCIGNVVDDKDFMYFWYKCFWASENNGGPITSYIPGEATNWVNDGKEVFARFRK